MKLMTESEVLNLQKTLFCEKHGDYEIRVQDGMLGKKMVLDYCPECAKASAVEAELVQKQEREKRDGEIHLAKMREAGISYRYFDLSLKKMAVKDCQKDAHAELLEYATSFGSSFNGGASLILAGTVGTGKTHMCQAMALDLIKSGHNVRMETARSIIRRIRDSWRSKSDGKTYYSLKLEDPSLTEAEVIKIYCGYSLLIVDEVGTQFGTEAEQLAMFDIINGRYNECLPTIVISNLDVKGISEAIGERAVDRLRDGGGKLIAFNWESLRK